MKVVQTVNRFCAYSVRHSVCCLDNAVKIQLRRSTTLVNSKLKLLAPAVVHIRNLGLGSTSKDFQDPPQFTGPMTKAHANELVLHLTDEEREMLYKALVEYDSNKIKEEFEDTLACRRWRTKLGRPSKVPTLGDVDPTGKYCPVPEDWLKKKYDSLRELKARQTDQSWSEAATAQRPSTKELLHLSLANSIPFIGFGFLDNFIMLIAGDHIESSMSAYITISTMAAAALGNTMSDVIGIGSAYYVERAAAWVGLGAPRLLPIQLDMPVCRRFANMGRVLGITLGCFLGMTPLLFRDDEKEKEPEKLKL